MDVFRDKHQLKKPFFSCLKMVRPKHLLKLQFQYKVQSLALHTIKITKSLQLGALTLQLLFIPKKEKLLIAKNAHL